MSDPRNDRRDPSAAQLVVERLLAGIAAGPTPQLADLYAPDAVVELPFARPGGLRLAGRQQLRDHFANAARAPFRLEPRNIVVHQTTDPDVVVAEYDYEGEILASGRRFTVSNVQIVRVQDGSITASRDFHDHAAIGAAAQGG